MVKQMKWLWGDTWKSEGVSYQLGRQGASDERSRRRKEAGGREAAGGEAGGEEQVERSGHLLPDFHQTCVEPRPQCTLN